MKNIQNTIQNLKENKDVILQVLKDEKVKFNRTLEKGLREFEKEKTRNIEGKEINKDIAFRLYDTYGFQLN